MVWEYETWRRRDYPEFFVKVFFGKRLQHSSAEIHFLHEHVNFSTDVAILFHAFQ